MKKSTKKDFEKMFQEDTIELLVLTKERVLGAANYGDYLKPSLEFIASVDVKTGILSCEKGHLEWLVKDDPDRNIWTGYNFQPFEIYRIEARKSIPIKIEPYMDKTTNNRYMVTAILEENASEPQLDKLQKKFAKPVWIEEPEIGIFELNRQFSFFEGEIEWLGRICGTSLDTDREDGTTAHRALSVLKKLYENLKEWDSRFRSYAAQELTSLANERIQQENGQSVSAIAEKDFAARLEISEVSIAPNGDLTVYYKDGGLFYGHVVIVAANISGEISDAAIAG